MLGVSVETLRRWETEGRLRMERSEGGQRLIEIDEVSRLLDERRKTADRSSDRRPVRPQPVRRRRHPDRTRPRRGRRRGHRRTSPAGQPDDRRSHRRPRPQGRRRGGLRRQGDQRHRRDPFEQGVAGMRSRVVVLLGVIAVVLAACSSGGHPRRRARPRPRPRRSRHGAASPAAAPVELTIYAAASLKAALEQAKAAYETANPGTTLVISTDASSALEVKIEQGAPADVFLSADTTNPQKLVDKGLTVGPAVNFARQQADGDRPDGQPGQDRDAQGPRQRRASRSSPPATPCRSRSTRPSWSPTWPSSPAIRRTSSTPTTRTSSPRRRTSAASSTKVATGQGDAGIVYVTDAMGKSADLTTDRRPADANVIATYAGVVVKTSPNPDAARRVPDLVRRA